MMLLAEIRDFQRMLCLAITTLAIAQVAQCASMLKRAGQGAFMACSDMRDAYKCLPVSKEQRRLQALRFMDALFIELKLIFGDRAACMFFDRFHYLILEVFVSPESSLPSLATGRTVDEIPAVVPANAKEVLVSFVTAYRSSLGKLNIEAAADDPLRKKAFDLGNSSWDHISYLVSSRGQTVWHGNRSETVC